MCQCVIMDCWWCNVFKECAGLANRYICIGCWMCAPESFPEEGKKCCTLFEASGFGGNFFCYGSACCAPDWLKGWSKSREGASS